MATLPSASDVREILQGYCIDSAIVTDDWILNRRDKFVVPIAERISRTPITGVKTVTDYYSGNNENYLELHLRNVLEIVNIQFVVGGGTWIFNLSNVELIADEGIIKAKRNVQETWLKPYFPKGNKNVKVTYKVGYAIDNIPDDLSEAIGYLTAEKVLSFLAGRGGGGDISIQSFAKQYGNRGKYTDIRNELARMGISILKNYSSSLVGQS